MWGHRLYWCPRENDIFPGHLLIGLESTINFNTASDRARLYYIQVKVYDKVANQTRLWAAVGAHGVFDGKSG